MAQYQCPDCGYIYDEARLPARGLCHAGTRWASLPDDFPCPGMFCAKSRIFVPAERYGAAGMSALAVEQAWHQYCCVTLRPDLRQGQGAGRKRALRPGTRWGADSR